MLNLHSPVLFNGANPRSISYSKEIAQPFDRERTRQQNRRRLDDMAVAIKLLTSRRQKMTMLDIGCGTGLYTIELAKRLKCDVTGADLSTEMLDIARQKADSNCVRWDSEDATKLSYETASFDVVFMSNLLHHLLEPMQVIQQAVRVLKPGGILVNHYGALDDILDDPEHRYFPEAIEIDARRTPTKQRVQNWFQQSGLQDVYTDNFFYKICGSADERISSIENKYVSVLHMITPDSFSRGLNRLKGHAVTNPADPWFKEISVKTTFGRKRSMLNTPVL